MQQIDQTKPTTLLYLAGAVLVVCIWSLISGDRSTELLLAGAARRPHDQREKVKDEDPPVTSKPPARFIF